MTNLALVTADRLRIVESLEQMTLPTNEDVNAGQMVRMDTSTGKFTKSNGSSAGEARPYGMAVKTVKSGMPVTAIKHGVVDGFDLASVAYDHAVYLSDTDGTLADSAGTVSTVLGRVIAASGQTLGTGLDKLLLIDI